MVRIIKNSFKSRLSNTVGILCIVSFAIFTVFGCEKYNKSNNNSDFDEQEFCSYLNEENINKTIPLIDAFLKNMSKSLDDEQKLQELVTWLKSHSCVTDAKIMFVSGIETLPPQSAIFFSFEENGIRKEVNLTISMGNPLKVAGNPYVYGGNPDILMLLVDYTTNTFKGGKEINFVNSSPTFTITQEYKAPCDFGYLKLYYQEINKLLFYGTIHWMGCGKMEFPQNVLPADSFQRVVSRDYIFPKNGFEDIFNYNQTFDYDYVWSSVQSLVKAREYLSSNPEQVVKMFLYTPSVGVGNPEDWYWVIYLKK